MADSRTVPLQLLITANDAASPEFQRLTGALNELGIETQVIVDGMAESERKAVAAFGAIAESAHSTGEMIEQGLVAALARIESPQGVTDLQRELQRLQQSGRLSGEELERLADAQHQLDRLADAAGRSEAALSQELQRQRIAAQDAADAADGLGDASGRSTKAFVDHRKESGALGEALSNVADQFGLSGEAFDALTGKLAKGAAIAALATGFVNANREADLLAQQFRAMTGDATTAATEIEFLKDVANRWGVAVKALAPAYLRLAAATKGTTAEGEATRKMIDDLTAAYMNAGAGVEDIEEAMEILGETFADGRVSVDDLKEGMQEDMPPAIQAATTAILDNNDALKRMLESGDAATEDFMPAFAAALREHIGGSTTHIDSVSAAFTRTTTALNELYVIPLVALFDSATQGVIKTFETLIGGASMLVDGFALAGNAVGAAAGALATGEDVMAAVGEEAERSGASIGKTALHLIGLKTATEEAALRQEQMKKELQALREETDPYGAALEALKKKLEDAAAEFAKTGDVVKLTQEALADFMAAPQQNLNVDGVLKLAAALKAVGNEAEDSGRQVSEGLGQELAKLSSQQLAELERQARSAMAAASEGSETSRAVFAELGQVVEGVVLARLQRLGVDGPEALRGISAEADAAIDDFMALASNADLSAETIEDAFAAALAKLDNPEELETFQANIEELGKAGVLTGEQVDQALLQIQQRMQEVASDPAFAALNQALAAIREETEKGIKTGNRERESLQGRIQGAIELAKARGDEAEAARLSAVATKDVVDQSERHIQQLQRQQTEIDAHIERVYAQAQADGVYTDEERKVVEALQDKSIAIGHDIQQIEAKLPLQQREAEEAARAAGLIGQLVRLYEDKAEAAGRETSAIERSYAGKVRDLKTEIAQAEAKGEAVKVQELKIEKAELEAEAAQALADAMAAQMAVEIEALEAKKLDILVSDQSTKAKEKEIAKIDELIAKKREQADAAKDTADQAKAAVEGEKQAAEATKQAGDEAEKTTAKVKALAVAWAEFGGVMASGFGIDGIRKFNLVISDIQRAIDQANTAAQRLADEGLGSITGGANNAAIQVENMARALDESQSYLNDAARAASNNLRTALKQAREEAEGLAQSMAGMAEDFRREILQMQGDQRALAELDYQDNLAKLDELHQRAGDLSDDEYQQAVKQAEALHRLKLQQLAEQQAAASRPTSSSSSASSASASAPAASGVAKTYELKLSGAGKALTAYTDTDPSAFLSAMEDAQRVT